MQHPTAATRVATEVDMRCEPVTSSASAAEILASKLPKAFGATQSFVRARVCVTSCSAEATR